MTTSTTIPHHRNVALLNQIADHLEAHPWAWEQARWFSFGPSDQPHGTEYLHGDHYIGRQFPATIEEVTKQLEEQGEGCGTRACIAGWATFLSGDEKVPDSYHDRGRQLLGITMAEADLLFCETWLPDTLDPSDLVSDSTEALDRDLVAKHVAEVLRSLAHGTPLTWVTNETHAFSHSFDACRQEEQERLRGAHS